MFVSKKKYNNLKSFYESELQDCFLRINKLNNDISKLKNKQISDTSISKVNEKLNIGQQILGIEKNKDGDLMAVLCDSYATSYLNYFDLRLIPLNKENSTFDTPICYVRENNESELKIIDIFAKNKFGDIGNGSIMLKYLKIMAISLGYNVIVGELSPVDIDRFEKLEHFYKKNGFEVSFSQSKRSGTIKVSLT